MNAIFDLETLPAPDGTLHVVDGAPESPAPLAWPVSLCGRMLSVRDGSAGVFDECPVCMTVAQERGLGA